jgi:hydroxymethylbilane synthase
MKPIIRLGTRGSQLALWQANYTKQQLESIGVTVEMHIIKTKGDRIQDLSFDKIEGKGFFTKEIEDALLAEQIDLAVHSMKDLPTVSPKGLVISAVSYREDPADTLIIKRSRAEANVLLQLPEGAVVGTSSARRKAQLLSFRPDLVMKDIRGNVDTRLRKLSEGEEYDAIVLASAGYTRLNIDLSAYQVMRLNPKEFVPAPAQGVLAFQTRQSDVPTRTILKQLHREDVAACTNVERTLLNSIGGGCQTPVGVYCEKDANNYYHLWAAVADSSDSPVRRIQRSSSTTFNLAENALKDLMK